MCVASRLESKRRMGRTPESPVISACQNASFPSPFGATTPTPVTTTRLDMLKFHLRPERADLALIPAILVSQRGDKHALFQRFTNDDQRQIKTDPGQEQRPTRVEDAA